MNLTINQVKSPINYIDNQLKNNKDGKDKKFDIELDDKKISEEEDKIILDVYQKSCLAQTCKSFEEFKKGLRDFPSVTAPGIVRKEWRAKLQNASEKEKWNMIMFSCACQNVLDDKKENMPNDLNGYINFMGEVKDYFGKCKDVSVGDTKYCQDMINVANSFETALKKYK